MNGRLDRKAFVTRLGAAGLGLGFTAAGERSTMAQEPMAPPSPGGVHGPGLLDEHFMLLAAFYRDFTAALAGELSGTNADEVDAAVRKAMMSVIDARQDDELLTYGQAEALKVLVATTPAPLGPGPIGMAMFGHHGGMAGGHCGMAPGMMPGPGSMEPGGMSPAPEGSPSAPMPASAEGMGHEGMHGAEDSQPVRKRGRRNRHDR